MPRAITALLFSAAIVALAVVSLAPWTASADTAVSLASGSDFSCAVTSGGGVKCWGFDDSGQLGDGSVDSPDICTNTGSSEFPCSKTPLDVVGLTSGVESVAIGDSHACVIMQANGAVKCWGSNQLGQLGNGATGPDTCETSFFDIACSVSPVDVVGLTDVVQLSLGISHSCARTSTGAVWCWGLSGWGQLGTEGEDTCGGEDCALTPVQTFAAGVQDIDAGGFHTCVINAQGGAECFGRNNRGQVGNGDTGPDSCHVGLTQPCSLEPDDVVGMSSGVTGIAAGLTHTCAIHNGEVKCWGDNLNAQMGRDNGSKNCSVPADTCFFDSPIPVAGVSGTMIEAAEKYTCVGPAISCWGANPFGALAGTSGPDQCSSGACSYAPQSMQGLAGDIEQLAPGTDHNCVLETSGQIECWGMGFYGNMGNGTNPHANTTPKTPTGFEGITTTPTAAAHPIGDANCDNVVNALDGSQTLGWISGATVRPDCYELSNVKCDDALDVFDILLIVKFAAELPAPVPAACRAIGT